MRSFRRDERGISPIVATILLIAITVIAAGVIASFVSGMYIGSTRLAPAGTLSGSMYDSNSDAAVAEYQDENVKLSFALTAGRIRDVGDKSDGIKVVLDWPQYGWGPVTIGPTGDRDYSKGYTEKWGITDNLKTWSDNKFALTYYLRIPCDAAGTFDSGSGDGILKLWVTNTTTNENISGSKTYFPNFWNENQTYMGMEVQSADGAFTTSFGTVNVYPQAWG